MRFILTPGAAYHSEIPPNFRLVLRTPSYLLYRRVGRTPDREPYDPPTQPGSVFNCSSPTGQHTLSQFRWAGVLPLPIVQDSWHGTTGLPGHTARTRVSLPRGRWDVSLQYVSFTKLTVRGPHLKKTIAPNYGVITSFWPAGTLTSNGRPFTLAITAAQRSWFGRLLGTPRSARSTPAPHSPPLAQVAFTVHAATPQRVPINDACGRYVDWVAPAGSDMRGR